MSTEQHHLIDQPVPSESAPVGELQAGGQGLVGHAHFLQRALSRRHFVKTAASATGIALGSGVFIPVLALADQEDSDFTAFEPRPIPGGIQPLGPGTPIFHVFLPGPGSEPSTITDFKGAFGVTLASGMGTRTDPQKGSTRDAFEVDIRFMQGLFVGLDGHRHRSAFALI